MARVPLPPPPVVVPPIERVVPSSQGMVPPPVHGVPPPTQDRSSLVAPVIQGIVLPPVQGILPLSFPTTPFQGDSSALPVPSVQGVVAPVPPPVQGIVPMPSSVLPPQIHIPSTLSKSLSNEDSKISSSNISEPSETQSRSSKSSSSASSAKTSSKLPSTRPKFSAIFAEESTSTIIQTEPQIKKQSNESQIEKPDNESDKGQSSKSTDIPKSKTDQAKEKPPLLAKEQPALSTITTTKEPTPPVPDVLPMPFDLADIPLPGQMLPKPKSKRQPKTKEISKPADIETQKQPLTSASEGKKLEQPLPQSKPTATASPHPCEPPKQPESTEATDVIESSALPQTSSSSPENQQEDNSIPSTSAPLSSSSSALITDTLSATSSSLTAQLSTTISTSMTTTSVSSSVDKKKRFFQSPLAIGLLPKLNAQSPLSIGPLPKLAPMSKENVLKSSSPFLDRKQKLGHQINPSPTSSSSRIHLVLKNRPVTLSKTVVPGFEDEDEEEEVVAEGEIKDNNAGASKPVLDASIGLENAGQIVIDSVNEESLKIQDTLASNMTIPNEYLNTNLNIVGDSVINVINPVVQSTTTMLNPANSVQVVSQNMNTLSTAYPQHYREQYVGTPIPASLSDQRKSTEESLGNINNEVRKDSGDQHHERKRKSRFDEKGEGQDGKEKINQKETEQIEFDLSKVKKEREDDYENKSSKSIKKKTDEERKEKRHKSDKRESLDRGEKERDRSDRRERDDRKRRRDDSESDKRRLDRNRSVERDRGRSSRDQEKDRRRSRERSRDKGNRQHGKRDRHSRDRSRSPGNRRYERFGSRERERNYGGSRGGSGRYKERSRSRERAGSPSNKRGHSRDRERDFDKRRNETSSNRRRRSREKERSASFDNSDRSRSRSRSREKKKRKSARSAKEDFLEEVSKIDAALSTSSSSISQSGKTLDSMSYETSKSSSTTEVPMVIDPVTSGNVIHTYYPDGTGDNIGFYPNPPDESTLNYSVPEHSHSSYHHGHGGNDYHGHFPEISNTNIPLPYEPPQQFENNQWEHQNMSHDQYVDQQPHFPTGVPPPIAQHQSHPRRPPLLPTPAVLPQPPHQQPPHPHHHQEMQHFPTNQQFPPDYQHTPQFHPPVHHEHHQASLHHQHHQFDEIPLPSQPQPQANFHHPLPDQNISQFPPQSIPYPNLHQNFDPSLPHSSSSSSSSTPPVNPNIPIVTSSSSFSYQQPQHPLPQSKSNRIPGFRNDGRPRKSRFSSPTQSPTMESPRNNLSSNRNDKQQQDDGLHLREVQKSVSSSRNDDKKQKVPDDTSMMESMVSSSGVEDIQSAADSEETGSSTDTSTSKPLKVIC